MTLSPPSPSVVIGKRATRVSFNDHPHTIEPISSTNERNLDSNPSNKTVLEERSCFTMLNQWWQVGVAV